MTIEQLKALDPCEEALDFAGQFGSVAKAWDNCTRGDWMLWLLRLVGTDNMTPRLLEFGDLLLLRLPVSLGSWDHRERSRDAIERANTRGATLAQVVLRISLAASFAMEAQPHHAAKLCELARQAADLRRLIPGAEFL